MRRSTRRSSMATSLDSALDLKRISTRRSSSILPRLHNDVLPIPPSRNLVGNFSTKFSMSSFVKKVEELTQYQRTAIENVGFGNVLRIPHFTLRKNLLVEWMERWDSEKRAFVVLGRELTIAPIDAALILGLSVTGSPVILNENEPFSDLEKEYGASSDNRRISVSAIEHRLESLGDSADEDFIRTFLLFTFATLLFHSSNAKIDSRYISLLADLDKVSDYAWGIAVVEDLFNWLSRRKEEEAKNVEGCLILLQIWSYEHIDIGRPNLLDCSVGFPRACCWESIRCNNPRHWFATKFNELEENQVKWKLQVTPAEVDINIIKELLEAKNVGKVVETQPTHTSIPSAVDVHTSTMSTVTTASAWCTRLPSKSICKDILRNETNEDIGAGKHDIREGFSENSQLSPEKSEITVEYPKCSSSFNMQEVQEDHTAETSCYVKEDYQFLRTENSKLKEDVVKLRRENALLRNQLSLNSSLEEETIKLRKEVVDQKEEIERLRLPAIALDNVERLLSEYFHEVQDASHPE